MKALITGITGQDGSYLAELLLDKGYEVYGMVRRSSTETFERIDHIKDRITFLQADLLDQVSLTKALRGGRARTRSTTWRPSRFVPTSWSQPVLTGEFTGLGVHADARGHAPGRARRPGSTRPAAARCSARCARCPRPS